MKTSWTWIYPALAVLLSGCAAEGTSSSRTPEAAVHPELWPEVRSPLPPDPELEQRVDTLLQGLSLEEKVGQTIQAEIVHVTADDIKRYHLGSVLNGGNNGPGGDEYAPAAEWLKLADVFWEASMDGSDGHQPIPILWGLDAVHGHTNIVGATIFPHNIALGATRNPDLIHKIGEATAREIAVTGQDWDFSPTVAVARDDRWGRSYESYSEDPEIVSLYATQMVEGLQGEPGSEHFLGPERVLATAKHFLGDGGTHGGKDQGDNLSNEAELRDIHGASYVAALEAGVQTVMASFNSWHGRKLHGHEPLLTGVLKGRMGFDGFVVGDWNGHGQVPGCSADSCAAALNAGLDMFMVPEDWRALFENTVAQVRSGEIPMARLDDAVRRILRVKMRAGLFERGKPSSRPLAGRFELLGGPEHRAVARQAVRESLVLLKNNGGLLPLSPGQRVLVAGDGADDIGKQSGGWTLTWQGTGNDPHHFPGATSIWQGIRQAVESGGGTAVLSETGSWEERPDVAVVVYGEDPYAEFQGDREALDYQPDSSRDLDLLRRLRREGVPVVSVFLSGRPLWVNPEINASDAFVAAWLPGSEGAGVADVLFRTPVGAVRHDFQGKLSFSWPGDATGTPVNRNDPVYEPLFAYGYGLDYTESVEVAELSETNGIDGEAGPSRSIYFVDGAVSPWRLYVGSAANWSVPEEAGSAVTIGPQELVLRSAHRSRQEDARVVEWSGTAEAQVYLQSPSPIDLSREANGDMALAFDVLVERPPTRAVTLRMDCGYPCSGALDVTEALATLQDKSWQTLRVRLSCFADAGADMTLVDTPFLLSTDGELSLRLAEIRLATAADGEAICPPAAEGEAASRTAVRGD